jgi:type VI secretion system secreted protein VgrG
MVIKLAGENISNMIGYLSVELSIGNHSNFRLSLTNEDRSANFKGTLSESSKKWIGKALEVEGLFKGIVTAIDLSRTRAGGSDFIIRGQSQTILLDDGVHSRSFGEKPLNIILNKVIEPYKSKFSTVPKIEPQFKKIIKYCVQYRESNFQFINRLAARYGEWFYYDGQKLIFGKPTEGPEITLNFERDLTFFDISVKTTPVNFKLLVYDYKTHTYPSQNASYQVPENEYAKIVFEKSKQDVYPQTTVVPISLGMNDEDLDQVTTLRQNVHLNELVVLSGASSNTDLKLGTIIKIVDTRTDLEASGTDNYGKYIITHLTHDFQANGEGYNNHFEAIPAEAAIPPLSISPDPPSCEMQLAEVIDNNDPKGMGRVRVQFIWQKDASGDDSKTNWIRVATPQGGGGKGFYMLPEIGDVVLVAFEHNHPERAYVLTGMYHGEAKPEHHDPNNYQKSWKTKGGNIILMSDEPGDESIGISSKKHVGIGSGQSVYVGAEEKINLYSPNGLVGITSDQTKIYAKTHIIINGEGEIKIKTLSTLILEGQDIKIKATGGIKMEAPKIDISADAMLSLKGATTSIKGSAMMDVESSGITSVSGSIVKIN